MDLSDQDMEELGKYFEGQANTASAESNKPAAGGK
jgi:cytochrome c553